MNLTTLDLPGSPFDFVETYFYYDGPKTFAIRSQADQDNYFVLNAVDEADEGEITFLAASIGHLRFEAMRSGLIEFRSVYENSAPGAVQLVSQRYDPDAGTLMWVAGEALPGPAPDKWLPLPSVRLSMPTATVRPFVRNDLLEMSQAQARTIYALEVEHQGARITEFPARQSGELQVAFDGAISAVMRELAYGQRNANVGTMRSSVLDLRAASFVLVMAIETEDALVEAADLVEAAFTLVEDFMKAVATGNRSSLISKLREYKPRARNRLVEILKPLAAVNSGLTLSTALLSSTSVSSTTVPAAQVSAAVREIEKAEPSIRPFEIHRGVLIGLNTRTRRFEIFDSATGETFKGEMSPEASTDANGLPVGDESFVSASLIETTPLLPGHGERAGATYYLEQIARYEL